LSLYIFVEKVLINLVLVVNGLDVLDLILPVDEEEVQQYVLAEVDHDHGLRLVVDLLVLEAADVMGITIGHLHMDPLEGIKKKPFFFLYL
jgi:hypothetical protein